MRGPGGHYLDNLIRSFFFFKNDFIIHALLIKDLMQREHLFQMI